MPGVKREFPDHPYNKPDGSPGDPPDYPTGIKQGERHKVKGISEIFYDAADNPDDPNWQPLKSVNVAVLIESLQAARDKNIELQDKLNELQPPEPLDPLDQPPKG